MTIFNNSQQTGIKAIEAFLASPNDKYLNLLGQAGTGKTFVISHIVNKHFLTHNFFVMGPTNKCTKVLRENGLRAQTITKFLKMKHNYSDDGDATFEPNIGEWSKMKITNTDILVVDECSMISVNCYHYLQMFQQAYDCSIIFIGDSCQLVPVQKDTQKNSVSFLSQTFNITNSHTFTEIVRSKQPVVQATYNMFRGYCEDENHDKLINELNQLPKTLDVRLTDNKQVFIKAFLKSIKKDANTYILTGSNVATSQYNALVMDTLYPDRTTEFVAGQRILITDYHRAEIVEAEQIHKPNYDKTQVGLCTGDLVDIDYIFQSEVYNEYFNINVNTYTIGFYATDNSGDGFSCELSYVIEKDYPIFSKAKSKKKAKIKKNGGTTEIWKEFYAVSATLHAPIDASYSMTVYKSQGSSFTGVYVDMADIARCRRGAMLRSREYYTAVSRAKQKIVLLVGSAVYRPATTDILLCGLCNSEKVTADFITTEGTISEHCLSCSGNRLN
jgi:hypothetical protein